MPAFGVRRSVAAAILLGTAALAHVACGGKEERTPPRPSGAATTGAGGDAAGGGGAGGDGGAGGTVATVCGNGVAETGELCDGADLNGQSCQALGFDDGAVTCKADCTLDGSSCSGTERCQDGRDNDGDLSFDCDDPDCAAACADGCAAPEVLPDPASVSGDTRGHALASTACAEPPGGPAAIYRITAATTGFLDVVVTAQTDSDLLISVRASCADQATELNCNNTGAGFGVDDIFSMPINQGDTVFIVISGVDPTQAGAFNLVAQSRRTVCGDGIQDPTEECDVIEQSAGDGCSDDCHLEPTETEPNNAASTANPYAVPFFGAISPAGDEDVVRVSVPTGPTTLVAETREVSHEACANNLLDSQVEILNSSGTTVRVSDNDGGLGLCSMAVAPSLPAGTYNVRVKAPPGSVTQTFPYRLNVTLVPEVCGNGNLTPGEQCDDGNTAAGDGCSATCRFELSETEPNGTSGQADPYADPWLAEISSAGDVDVVAVSVPGPSSTLWAAIGDNGTGACMAGLLDSYIEILGANGSTVLQADDDTGLGYCSFASATGLAAGTYFVKIRSAPLVPDATFFYRLDVTLP
jgi:cysteine-rich repeat protein